MEKLIKKYIYLGPDISSGVLRKAHQRKRISNIGVVKAISIRKRVKQGELLCNIFIQTESPLNWDFLPRAWMIATSDFS